MQSQLTALCLCLMLEGIVGLHTLEELLLAAGRVHMLHTHMDALGNDASVHLVNQDRTDDKLSFPSRRRPLYLWMLEHRGNTRLRTIQRLGTYI